jgi:hypothetical protein
VKLGGARLCASDLNAKLDLGDETEECHGLTTSATYEKHCATEAKKRRL